MLVEAARLAEAEGDLHALAEILGSLDVESLWAGYDWSLHDPRVVAAVERALARPGLTARDRTLLTMALAGELTYVDNARSNHLFAEARAHGRDRSTTPSCRPASCSAGSGRSRVRPASRRGRRSATSSSRSTATAPSPPGCGRSPTSPGCRRPSSSATATWPGGASSDARMLAHPVRTPTGWAHLQFAEAGLALLDGDLERARGHAAALRPALQRVRRYTADSSPASILAVVETESGDIDAALGWLTPLLASPYAAPIRWLEAWVLSRGRPTRRRTGCAGRASTARCPTTGCSSR